MLTTVGGATSYETMIPETIEPRINNIPVKNKYELLYNKKHRTKYIVSVYYIDESTCAITVRKTDKNHLLSQNPLTVRFHALDEGGNSLEEEKIAVLEDSSGTTGDGGASYSNIFKLERVKLVPLQINYTQHIPKIIMQTHETYQFINDHHKIAFYSWIDLNPEYTYVFFNNIERRQFIKKHFSSAILNAYDKLIPNAYKADIFRCCWLYQNGGCYCDHKSFIIRPLRDLIKPDDKYVLSSDAFGIFNGFIVMEKRHRKLLELINHTAWLINDKLSNRSFMLRYRLHGPNLFAKIFKGYTKVMSLTCTDKLVTLPDNKVFIVRCHQDYYQKHYGVFQQHYSKLVRQNKVFYQNKQRLAVKYICFVFPPPHSCKNEFLFSFEDNDAVATADAVIEKRDAAPAGAGGAEKKKILKISSDQSWKFPLKIIIINHETSETNSYDVGENPTSCIKRIKI